MTRPHRNCIQGKFGCGIARSEQWYSFSFIHSIEYFMRAEGGRTPPVDPARIDVAPGGPPGFHHWIPKEFPKGITEGSLKGGL